MSQTLEAVAAPVADEVQQKFAGIDRVLQHYRPSFYPLLRKLVNGERNPSRVILCLEVIIAQYAKREGLPLEQEMVFEGLSDVVDIIVGDLSLANEAKRLLANVRSKCLPLVV